MIHFNSAKRLALGFLLLAGALIGGPGLPARADVNVAAPAYILSPDDQVDIVVRGHEDFKASTTLLPDGTFNYPVLGKVHAAGETIDALTLVLTAD